MKAEVAHFTTEQMVDMVGLLSPCMDDYLYVCDFKEDYYQISPNAVKRFCLPADHFHNVVEMHRQVVYPDDLDLLLVELELLSTGRKVFHNLHYRWMGKNHETIWINCRGRVLSDPEDGSPRYLVGCINEIGAKQKADNVSGLLGEYSLKIFYESRSPKLPQGFLLRIGIDDFKDINESHGNEYGDYILRRTAQCIEENIGPEQSLFHIVADEFAVVDFSGGSVQQAEDLFHEIKKSIYAFIEQNQYKAVYTVSGGIVKNGDVDNSFENAMKLSEFALSEAKERGKNSCYVFEEEEYEDYLKSRTLLRQLHHAVNNGFEGFEAYFQPLVNAANGELTGAETLLRFHSPEGGMVSPGEFIPILEESGLIIPVGRWVLRQALDACREWQKILPEFKVNVNLSYVQVLKSRVLTDVRRIVDEFGVKPSSVCIELTESGYLEENERFDKVWNGLKEYGVLLALDDFGTGYSNLRCLSDLKPAYIKIDRSFTLKALNREYEYRLLNHIVEMSHSLGLHVCVEGIETEGELTKAKQTEPDYIQGFLFGKPCSRAEFTQKFFTKQAG